MATQKAFDGGASRIIQDYQVTIHLPQCDLSGAWLRIEHEIYEPTYPRITLLHADFGPTFPGMGLFDEQDEFHMTCQIPFQFPISFWGILGSHYMMGKVELRVIGYKIGCSAEPLPPNEEVTIFVYLTGGQVLRRRDSLCYSYDGTITNFPGDQTGKDIEWDDDRGHAILRIQHEHEEHAVGTNQASIRIGRPVFVRSFVSDGRSSLNNMINQTEGEIKDIVRMVSFCSRERVNWYAITIETYRSQQQPRLNPRAQSRGGVPVYELRKSQDPLIDHMALIEGGFKDLLDSFRSSTHRNLLERAIAYQVASRQKEGGIEENYIFCHAALDALASGLSLDDPSIPCYQDQEWNELRDRLVVALDEFGRDKGVDTTLISRSKSKLLELRRPPIAALIKHHVDALGVKVDDLWPLSGFEKGLRQALEIRNTFIHQAIVNDLTSTHENLLRLQILIERFILKLLRWPDDKVWAFSTLAIERINRRQQ